VASSCEHCKAPSGFMKVTQFLGQLGDCQLFQGFSYFDKSCQFVEPLLDSYLDTQRVPPSQMNAWSFTCLHNVVVPEVK
jgi:hypothetical protein